MSQIETAVVGSGGREHELGRQLDLADEVSKVYFLDGNAGTEDLAKGQNIAIKPSSIDEIVSFADEKQLGLTLIGPEAPLVAGVVDRLRAKGLTVFGPSAEAARLEASKAYAEEIMEELGLPRPPTVVTHSYGDALSIITGRSPMEYVIKADGLAGGKGVVLADSFAEADRTLIKMYIEGGFDGAGKDTVLIQDRWHGPEVSVSVVSDGRKFTDLLMSQDHKRLLEGDKGPNTGGMGAYAPLPPEIVSQEQEQKIHAIAERVIEGMRRRGTPYQGLLYIGIMLAQELGGDPAIIEFNSRFGDPETQVVLPPLRDAGIDVFEILRSSAEGNLTTFVDSRTLGRAALTVCLAAEGYPDNPKKGQIVYGLNRQHEGVIIHHAGTKKDENGLIKVTGGRAVYLTGFGEDVDVAAERAYDAAKYVTFDGWQYRRDIGHQARKAI